MFLSMYGAACNNKQEPTTFEYSPSTKAPLQDVVPIQDYEIKSSVVDKETELWLQLQPDLILLWYETKTML